MTDTPQDGKRIICTRKEPRFKTRLDKELHCETTLSQCGLRRGSVMDVSTTGIRLLCEGDFEVGQPIFTELATDQSHGIYQGVIRRVQPWKDGFSVLGCSLNDPIPADVLEDLASEGVVSRRAEDRMELNEKAKVSWQLNSEEVEVEIKDYSPGGMQIKSNVDIPENVPLRVRFEQDDDEQVIVEAKSVWYSFQGEDFVAGVQFTDRDSPRKLTDFIIKQVEATERSAPQEASAKSPGELFKPIYLVACVALIGLVVLMSF